jgi:diacylglycerol kinase (ATP)
MSNIRVAIVANPAAGSGRAMRMVEEIVSILEHKNISFSVFDTSWPNDFDGFSDVWIVGGDGTLHFFINKYPGIQLPLVIFAGGSGNDFHWRLYKEKAVSEIVELGLTATPTRVDAGECNGILFMNSAGAGFDGAVVKTILGKNKRKGKISFYQSVMRNIFSYRELEYTITGAEKPLQGRYLIVSVMNTTRAGGGFYIAPKARIDDGLLDLTILTELPVLKRLLFLPRVEKGKHEGLNFLKHFTIRRILVECDRLMDAQLDGEYFQWKKMEIKVLPAHFQFRF